MTNIALKTATEEERSKLPVAVTKEDKVFAGKLRLIVQHIPSVLLVEFAQGGTDLYVDVDDNETFTAAERFTFTAPPAKDQAGKAPEEILLKFPLSNSPFKYFPMRLSRPTPGAGAKAEDTRYLPISVLTFAEGKVNLDGRQMLVRYGVNAKTGLVNPAESYVGLDCDGDGQINASRFSPESFYASSSRNEIKVFHAGRHYLSTKSVDPATGQIVLREHPASDYTRIEMRRGQGAGFRLHRFQRSAAPVVGVSRPIPDPGIWGSWCKYCVAEIPHLKAAYEKYQSRGLEILGMDSEDVEDKGVDPAAAQQQALEKVRKFVAEKGATWTQATTESVGEIIDQRFRIVDFPTTLLLDPQGRIISLGELGGKDQMPLQGEKLMETLEKVLRAKP